MPGKEMGTRGPRRSAQDWTGLIKEWQLSGIDLVEFCREEANHSIGSAVVAVATRHPSGSSADTLRRRGVPGYAERERVDSIGD